MNKISTLIIILLLCSLPILHGQKILEPEFNPNLYKTEIIDPDMGLSSQYPDRVHAMKQKWDAWFESVDAERRNAWIRNGVKNLINTKPTMTGVYRYTPGEKSPGALIQDLKKQGNPSSIASSA